MLSIRERCHARGLVKESDACLPSILIDTKNVEKSSDGPSENNDFNSANLAGTALIPRIDQVIKAITISDFLEERSFEKSIRSGSSHSSHLPLFKGGK